MLHLKTASVPAGVVLCPLWLPKLSAFDNAADHGGGGDKQVSGSLKEGGGYTQGLSEKKKKTRTEIKCHHVDKEVFI